MLILGILVASFTPLFLVSMDSLVKSGQLHVKRAESQGKLAVVISTNDNFLDEDGTFTEKKSSTFPVRISGITKNIEGSTIEAGEIMTYVASTTGIKLSPDTLNEDYNNNITINIIGKNTHFIASQTELEIKDKNNFLVSSSKYRNFSVLDATSASFKLNKGLNKELSPYMVTLKAGSEKVSALLTVESSE